MYNGLSETPFKMESYGDLCLLWQKKFKLKMCFLLLNVIAIFSQGGAEGPRGAGHKQTPIPTLSDLPNHGQVLYAFFNLDYIVGFNLAPFWLFQAYFSQKLLIVLPSPSPLRHMARACAINIFMEYYELLDGGE